MPQRLLLRIVIICLSVANIGATCAHAQAASVDNLRASQQAYTCISESYKKWFGISLSSKVSPDGQINAISNISLYYSYIEREGFTKEAWDTVWQSIWEIYGNQTEFMVDGRNIVADFTYDCYYRVFESYLVRE